MLNQATKLLFSSIILLFISVISYKFYSSSFNLQLGSCSSASSSCFGPSPAEGAQQGVVEMSLASLPCAAKAGWGGFTWDIRLLSTVFSFLISFCFSYYVLDKFTYSDNKYIRILQRFLF